MKKATGPSVVETMVYNARELMERAGEDGAYGLLPAEGSPELPDEAYTRWIRVVGLKDNEMMGRMAQHFHIHALTIEDIITANLRPKIEEHRGYLFCRLNVVLFDKKLKRPVVDPVSFILCQQTVISFQDRPLKIFDSIQKRLRLGVDKIRSEKADYLFYSLLDVLVDFYFPIIERYHKKILNFENKLIHVGTQDALEKVYQFKNELNLIKKRIFPARTLIFSAQKLSLGHLSDPLRYYLKDLYENVHQVNDELTGLNDKTTALFEMIISINSFKMNEAMKTLTIIATIFMPLTFISGIYGMNFKHIPELEWKWGFYFILFLMVLMGTVMAIWIKKKKWL